MDTGKLDRMIEEFQVSYAESVAASDDLATRFGLSGQSEEWLRRLPRPVADAVRRAAEEGWEQPGESCSQQSRAVAAGDTIFSRAMSPADFVYRTLGR